MVNYRRCTLKNGMRVVMVPHEDTLSATILVLVGVGSRHENRKCSGVAHVVEHMMFKGTRKRPTTLDISRDLDGVGADYNAFTGKEYTGYYIRLASERFPMAIDMLHDMLEKSAFRAKDIVSEKGVIIEEIRMYEDSPSELVDELLTEALFPSSPLGKPIAGTVDSVTTLKREDIINFRDEHYRPSSMVLAVAGKFNEKETIKQLEKTFGSIKQPKTRARAIKKESTSFTGPKHAERIRETEQMQLSIGFRAYAMGHKDSATLGVLSTILGGTMSSRLFMSVREREGLCYAINSGISAYADIGDIVISAGLAKDKTRRAAELIMHELASLKKTPVTDEELSRAKEYIRGKMILGLENSSRIADWYARQELLLGKTETPEERLSRILAVTKADIRRVAKEVFTPKGMALSMVGPLKKDECATLAKQCSALL